MSNSFDGQRHGGKVKQQCLPVARDFQIGADNHAEDWVEFAHGFIFDDETILDKEIQPVFTTFLPR